MLFRFFNRILHLLFVVEDVVEGHFSDTLEASKISSTADQQQYDKGEVYVCSLLHASAIV